MMNQCKNIAVSIFIILQLILGSIITPTIVSASEQDGISYLDFDNDIFISSQTASDKATHIYNSDERIAITLGESGLGKISDIEGNNVVELTAPSATELAASSAKLYYAGISDGGKYRIGWNFCRKQGARIDITFENGVGNSDSNLRRVGFIRFKADNTIVIKNNWASETQSGSGNCTPDVWHSLEGEFDQNNKKAVWYLDGKKVGEYIYQADGKVAIVAFQAVAPDQDSVINKKSVFLMDDIEYQKDSISSSAFYANTVADNGKISMRLTHYPWNTDISVKLASGENVYSPVKIERFGKRYEFSFAEGVIKDGNIYTFSISGTVRSAIKYTKTLETSSFDVGVLPNGLDISIIPHTVGGIYTDSDILKFDVTVKNTKTTDVSAAGIVNVKDKDGNIVTSVSLGEIQLTAQETRSFTVSPEWSDESKRYGNFTLGISLKQSGEQTSIESSIPFSRILSNGVQNHRMGVNGHYVDKYNTDLNDFDKEISLNSKAGIGIVRNDFHWNLYEAAPGEHYLTNKQTMLFETLAVNNITPYAILGNGTWTYGEFWPYPVGKTQLERYGEYVTQASVDTIEYAPVFEVGNEWNSNYPEDPPENYVEMMRVAYESVKCLEKNAQVVGFAIGVSDECIEFLEECLKLGAAQYCDAVSIHPYSVLESPEEFDVRNRIKEVSDLLEKYGAKDMPIIISEWGWSSSAATDCTEELQAMYSIRGVGLVGDMVNAIMWYEGQERYNGLITEESFGLLKRKTGNAPLSAKPLYVALSCLNSLTGDKEQKELEKDENGTYISKYENGNEITVQFWNPNSEKSISIDAIDGFDNAMLYDMYGNHDNISVANGKYNLTAKEEPSYLVLSKGSVGKESFYNSFEQDFNIDLGTENGSIYFDSEYDGAERIVVDRGNGVLRIPTQKEIAVAGAMGFRSSVEKKKYVLSFDFYAKQTDTKFMFQARDTANKAFIVFTIGGNGKVGFAKNGGWSESNPDDNFFATDYKAGRWNRVDIVVDPLTQVLEYFINGVSVGSKKPEGNVSTAVISFISFFTGIGNEEGREVYFDNFSLNYADKNDFDVMASINGNTITVEFSETLDLSNVNKILLNKVKLLGGQSGFCRSSVSSDGRKLYIRLPISAEKQFTVILPEGIKSVTGQTLSEKYLTLFRGVPMDTYIQLAVLKDVVNEKYLTGDDIPITQDYIELKTIGNGFNLNSMNSVSFVDEDGNECALGAPLVVEDGIKIPITTLLNKEKEYTLNVTGTDGVIHRAKFYASNEAADDGFAGTDIVLSDGNSVYNVVEGDSVFVSSKYINLKNTGKNAMIGIAAYEKKSNTDNELRLLSIDIKTVDVGSSEVTSIGPGNHEIAITVPAGTDVIKTFIWDANTASPMTSSVVR